MNSDLEEFLSTSPLSRNVILPAKIVVQRTRMSASDIALIKKEGSYRPAPSSQQICELFVGGQLLAHGRIVKKKGEYYFRLGEAPAVYREKQEARR